MKDIRSQPSLKEIVWTASDYCNYKCSYCSEKHYGRKYPWPKDYSKLINFIKDWRGNDPLKFDVMGGEPTIWPKFSDFCADLKNTARDINKTFITFSTNASRTIRYWNNFDYKLDEVILSFHPEYADIDHFLEICNLLCEKYRVGVFLMMPAEHYEYIRNIFENLKKEKFNKATVIIKLVDDWKNGTGLDKNYTTEMLEFSKNKIKQLNPPKKDISRTLVADDREVKVRDLINSNQTNFKGWHCWIGKDILNIEADGSVYGSQCKVRGPLGHIDTGIEIPTAPTVCTKNYCLCGSDVIIDKYNYEVL